MAGRRNTGGAATLVGNLMVKDRERRLNQEDKRREFDQRLQQAGIVAGIKSGQISPTFGPQGQVGFQPKATSATDQLLDMQKLVDGGAQVTQTIKTPQGTITIKHGGQKAAQDKQLPPAQTAQMLAQAQPGQPMPLMREGAFDPQSGKNRLLSNVPVGPAGVNTVNAAIQQGRTESPDALMLGQRLDLNSVPQGPFVNGPDGSFISGGPGSEVASGYGVPRQRVIDQLYSQRGMQGRNTPQAASPLLSTTPRPAPTPQAQASNDPIAERIEQLRASGMPDQQIANFLRQKKIDPSTYGL